MNDHTTTDHDDNHTVNDEVIKVFEGEPKPTFEISPIVQCSVASSNNKSSNLKSYWPELLQDEMQKQQELPTSSC